jgi:hypothetical protein
MDSITNALGPAVSGKLGQALIGVLILVVGLFIVKLLGGLFKRLLNKVGFLQSHNLANPIASLIKAVMTIFVLIAVLQHFGLTGVLDPLKDMVAKFLGVIPNIIGAGVIGYAGWIIAKIVSELVGVGLQSVEQRLIQKTGSADVQVAKIGSTFVFAAILLPIAVAALGVLGIPAISDPASAMITKLMAAIPNIIGAVIILAVAYFVTKFVVQMLSSILGSMGVDQLPEKLGMQSMFSPTFTPTRLVGGAIMFFSMLTATTAAVNTLGIDIISTIFAKVLEFGGGILIGSVILLVGFTLSNIAYNKLSESSSAGLAGIARFAILGLVLAMGLKAMGLADNIVNMAFGFTIGAVAIAAAIAFGLGGQEAAKYIANNWAKKLFKD